MNKIKTFLFVLLFFISDIIVIVVNLNPNLPLLFEQLHRSSEIGIKKLSTFDKDNILFISFAEYLYKQNKTHPEKLVYKYIPYCRDIDNYLNVDYWATPIETLKSGCGDCEDRAILAMAVLDYVEEHYKNKYEKYIVMQDFFPIGHVFMVDKKQNEDKYMILGGIMEEKRGGLLDYLFELPPYRLALLTLSLLFVNLLLWKNATKMDI